MAFPNSGPVVTYNGRYWTRWFIANAVAKRIPTLMPSVYPSVADVVEITPEIDKKLKGC